MDVRLALIFVCFSAHLSAVEVPVASTSELLQAVAQAQPGDVILLSPGTYDVAGNIPTPRPGLSAAPVTVRGPSDLSGLIRFDAVEGFKVSQAHWHFEYLDIQGACATHSQCEHAFHLFGRADGFRLRHSRLREYNAAIKSNGLDLDGSRFFPNDVVVEYNEIFNSTVRQTANPVTPVDVVGGRRWTLRGNLIYDFAKGQGNGISYAAFFKGNSRDGVMERNLVICERFHTPGIRLGLSLGGGGSGPPSICEDATCTPEHQNGILRNNLILNCPDDVGIYLNEAMQTGLYNNTLYNTTGIDVRFAASSAEVRNNLVDGPVRNRDGGTHTATDNLLSLTLADYAAWFEDPGAADFTLLDGASLLDQGLAIPQVTDDYCGRLRSDGLPDLGALEFGDAACDTSVGGGFQDLIFRDDHEQR